MRETSAFFLLLLAGCAAAQPPEPRPLSIRLAPGIASVTIPDSAQWVPVQSARLKIVNGACQPNDPMPTGHFGRVMLPPSLPMPNASTPHPPAYIPNACPVTAGPLANRNVPAANPRGEKRIREPQAQSPRQP
jgi:hypothetical protein